MGAAKKINYKKVLRDLVPINALSEAHIDEVTSKATFEDLRSGRYVFRKGDRDYQSVYLLEGTIELIGAARELVSTVKAGSEDALHPLAQKQPRQLSARACGKVTVARIDSRLLDVLLTWDESAGYDVVELDAHDDDDWMTRMLQSQAFLQLPPSNIHQLLMRLESVNTSAGDVVINQGDDGDYFYIVRNGRLQVTRKASPKGKEVLLAELGEGACFGEEALVSETRRNASVTMATDGMLMRLSKDDFNELLRAPLVHEASFAEAQELVAKGAHWLDVRLPGEFENQAIKSASNLPLSALRDQCADLDSNTTYIVCCDTGWRSSAGAFVLSQRGFNVFTLKNGFTDVPDIALIGKQVHEPAGDGGRDAEIIPFDTDGKSSVEAVRGETAECAQAQPVDTALIDKLALLEKEKASLQQQLKRADKQSAETTAALKAAKSRNKQEHADSQQARQQVEEQLHAVEQEKHRFRVNLDAATQALEASQRRAESVEAEKNLLQQELDRLQQTLSQVQASADGRDSALAAELEQMAKRLDQQQQTHEKQRRELDQELSQLRKEHQELGQHAGAVDGEREAAFRELEQVRQELASTQQQLDTQQGEASEQQESLNQRLQQQEKELEEEKNRRQSLEQQSSELDDSRKELEQQIQSVSEQADAGQSRNAELEAQLAANEQKLQEVTQSLTDAASREQSLQARLQQAESETGTQQAELHERIAALQLQIDEQTSQHQQQLEETRQSLEQAAERERQLEEQLKQRQGDAGQIQQALDQAVSDADALRKQLDEAKQQSAASEKRVAELDSRLSSIEKEHASDIDSLREALTRAQDERENVSREQTRLMGAVRKAEGDLERARQDHETDVHRLQKELKEAAGESSAGLAAELDAVREQLGQGAQQRDDLEIQLGERSAQLESAQAEAERLSQRLKRAQETASQAEQQLIEANQAANEEMTIRLDAEQQAQQALREQLDTAISERNQHQERLTVLNHELEEQRSAVQQAQGEAAANRSSAQALQDAEQQMQVLHAQLQQLEQALGEARNSQCQAQQEVDQLRAEAEVSRGLEKMQASVGDTEEALHAELVESKTQVETAVRLRIQAEEQAAGLQQEIDRLRFEVSQASAVDSVDEEEVRVPSLDDTDPQAASLLIPGLDDQDDYVTAPEESDGSKIDHEAVVPAFAVDAADADKTGGAKILLIMLLTVGLAAAGAYWWFVHKPSLESSTSAQTPGAVALKTTAAEDADPPTAVEHPQQAETQLHKDGSQQVSDRPKILPSFARGMSDSPIPANAGTSIDDEAAAQEVPAATQQDAAGKPAVEVEEAAEPVQAQPARTFREALKIGGAAPTMVEFGEDSFDMGSSSASPNFAERPRHRVSLKRFAIAKHEVTFDQYDQFAKASGRSRPNSAGWGRGIRPVINVSWQDAVAYTDWLSKQTGSRYRLPTEAEWEFAARSGSDRRFWWGHKVGEGNANCFDCGSEWSGSKTAPVGSFAESAYAMHDMAGNVMEWVQDCYRAGYADAPQDGSAVELGGCKERVVRGGGFDSPADLLRSASRHRRAPKTRLDNLGFRVVKEF